VCGWQVNLCDPLVTHGPYLSALAAVLPMIRRYTHHQITLTVTWPVHSARRKVKVNVAPCRDHTSKALRYGTKGSHNHHLQHRHDTPSSLHGTLQTHAANNSLIVHIAAGTRSRDCSISWTQHLAQ